MTRQSTPERHYIVRVDMGSPCDETGRYLARSPAAARYASFKAWRHAGYGARMSLRDAFLWFSKNIVVSVSADRSRP